MRGCSRTRWASHGRCRLDPNSNPDPNPGPSLKTVTLTLILTLVLALSLTRPLQILVMSDSADFTAMYMKRHSGADYKVIIHPAP